MLCVSNDDQAYDAESSPQLLLEILDTIINGDGIPRIQRMLRNLRTLSVRRHRQKAAQTIIEKLRTRAVLSPQRQSLDAAGVRRLVLDLNRRQAQHAAAAEPAVHSPADAVDLCIKKLTEGLCQYVKHALAYTGQPWHGWDSMGGVIHPVLPMDVHILDTISAAAYHSFILTCTDDSARWALCRILLSLHGQWWWLDCHLTPWQADSIATVIEQRYYERYCLAGMVIAQHPWSREASMMVLMGLCRDTLINMARGKIVYPPAHP